MKMLSTLTSAVVMGFVFAGFVRGDLCPTQTLIKLSSSINLAGCTSDTGLSMTTLSSLTTDQVTNLCDSSFCMTFLKEVESENLGNCTIPGLNIFVESDILDQVMALCSGSGSTGSMSMESSFSGAGINVGDESGDSSSNSDNITGSNATSPASNVETGTVGIATLIAATLMLLV